jgi:hypothetical protein
VVDIALGSALITLIEPTPGHAAAYNRWYERDHVYAVLQGPGAISAARFVARRQDKARRHAVSPLDVRRGAFLAVYWFDGDGARHRAWRNEEAKRLEAAGRIYRERDYVFGFDGRLVFSRQRDPAGVPLELALDHRFPHLGMTVIEPSGEPSPDDSGRLYADLCAPALTVPSSPIDLCVGLLASRATLARERRPAAAPSRQDDLVVLWFCESDPGQQWASLLATQEKAAVDTGLGQVVWASPFIATVPGTDTYMDEL